MEARDALAPLLPVFSSLVSRTWTRGRNVEFLARVSKLAERRKWSQLLTTFRAALRKVWPRQNIFICHNSTLVPSCLMQFSPLFC